MNKKLKLTEEEIVEILRKDRIISNKTISKDNYNRLLHSIKTIINLQIKLIDEQV